MPMLLLLLLAQSVAGTSTKLHPDVGTELQAELEALAADLVAFKLEEEATVDISGVTGARLMGMNDNRLNQATLHACFTFLRLKRYMMVSPRRLRMLDGFTDSRTKFVTSLVSLATSAYSASSTAPILLSWKTAAGASVSVATGAVSELMSSSPDTMLVVKRSAYIPPDSFETATLANYLEAFAEFVTYYDATNNRWDMDKIDKLDSYLKAHKGFTVAAATEEVIASPAVTRTIYAAKVLGFVLICTLLVSPAFIPIAATQALLASVTSFGAITTATVSAFKFGATNSAHLGTLLILQGVLEIWRQLEHQSTQEHCRVPCDITDNDCPAGTTCARHLLFYSIGESELQSEYSKTGICVPLFKKLNDDPDAEVVPLEDPKHNGEGCNLHRQCQSGYCHFHDPSRTWSSAEMWFQFDQRSRHDPGSFISEVAPRSVELSNWASNIPNALEVALLEIGVCAQPVPTAATAELCVGDSVLTEISANHEFKACVQPDSLPLYPPARLDENNHANPSNYLNPLRLASRPLRQDMPHRFWNAHDGHEAYWPRLVEEKRRRLEDGHRSVVDPWQTVSHAIVIPLTRLETGTYHFDSDALAHTEVPIRFGDYVAIAFEMATNAERAHALSAKLPFFAEPGLQFLKATYSELDSHVSNLTTSSIITSDVRFDPIGVTDLSTGIADAMVWQVLELEPVVYELDQPRPIVKLGRDTFHLQNLVSQKGWKHFDTRSDVLAHNRENFLQLDRANQRLQFEAPHISRNPSPEIRVSMAKWRRPVE